MAPRTRIVKKGALFLSQFGLLAALNFQLFGIVTAQKTMELKRNLSLAAYLSAKKTYLQRKRRNLQARRVRRKRRSVWVINGRTDQWWQNMIGEDVPDWNKGVFHLLYSTEIASPLQRQPSCFLENKITAHVQAGLKFRFDYMRVFQIFRPVSPG